MKNIWAYIDKKKWHADTKYKMLLLCLGILFALAGFAVWLIVRTWAFSSWDWLLCFIGYPVICSWFIVFFYSCRHDFHDGKYLG